VIEPVNPQSMRWDVARETWGGFRGGFFILGVFYAL